MSNVRDSFENFLLRAKIVWRRSTVWERLLFAVSITLGIMCIVLACLIRSTNEPQPIKRRICTNANCVTAANMILEKLDETVDPCDDFYQFSCGAYLRYNSVPPDNYLKSIFTDAEEYLWRRLKVLLESSSKYDDVEGIRKLKQFYASCVKENGNNANIKKDFRKLIGEVGFDDSPFSTKHYSRKSLEEVLALTTVYGRHTPFFRLYANQESRGSVIGILLTNTILKEEKLLNVSKLRKKNEYMEFVFKALLKLGSPWNLAETTTSDIVSFETAVANITSAPWSNHPKYFNVSEISSFCPVLNWTMFLNNVYIHLDLPPKFTEKQVIVKVTSKEYLKEICDLLEAKEDRTIDNYIIWSFIFNYLPYLSGEFRTDYNSIKKEMNILKYFHHEQWKECLSTTIDHFKYAMTFLYLEELRKNKTVEKIFSMAANLKDTYDFMFSNQEWVDTETKNMKTKQLKKLNWKLGYPVELMNPENISALVSKVLISDKWIKNLLSAKKEQFNQYFLRSVSEQRIDRELAFPLGVGVSFITSSHSLAIQLGLILPYFFIDNAPMYLNYGAIGTLIGHQISRGYGHLDIHTPDHPFLTKSEQQISSKEFQERQECFTQQYSSFKLNQNETLDGIHTLDENVADYSGLQQSFHAYRSFISQKNEEDLLPGLNYSSQQLFFIRYAQVFCELPSERMYELYKFNRNTPGKYRVNGALQNSFQFSVAYRCRRGSSMNPEKKCDLWG